MNEAIVVALIGAVSTVLGVIISNRSMLEKQAAALDKALAVHEARTNERIDELTREVREHNNYVHRVPVLEEKVNQLERRA